MRTNALIAGLNEREWEQLNVARARLCETLIDPDRKLDGRQRVLCETALSALNELSNYRQEVEEFNKRVVGFSTDHEG